MPAILRKMSKRVSKNPTLIGAHNLFGKHNSHQLVSPQQGAPHPGASPFEQL
jgi:hypothetical protein